MAPRGARAQLHKTASPPGQVSVSASVGLLDQSKRSLTSPGPQRSAPRRTALSAAPSPGVRRARGGIRPRRSPGFAPARRPRPRAGFGRRRCLTRRFGWCRYLRCLGSAASLLGAGEAEGVQGGDGGVAGQCQGAVGCDEYMQCSGGEVDGVVGGLGPAGTTPVSGHGGAGPAAAGAGLAHAQSIQPVSREALPNIGARVIPAAPMLYVLTATGRGPWGGDLMAAMVSAT